MWPSIALFACIVGIGGLLFLDRDNTARTSKALWLPVTWLWINGSRPISSWFGMTLELRPAGQAPDGSLLDQLVAAMLISVGMIVIVRRGKDVSRLIRASWPIALYFAFCLASILWSDFPDWSFKRWIRALGDLIMAIIVATDKQPIAAFKRFLSRIGFVLFPTSILLIRYYPHLGRSYEISGLEVNTGVTANKNMLGAMAYALTLGTLWQVLTLLRSRKEDGRKRRLLAQCTLLAFGLDLLFLARSATSTASFALGAGLMLVTALPFIGNRPAVVHMAMVAILLGGGVIVALGGKEEVVKAMGRNPDLTGRTEIWEVLSASAPNSMVGAGFESFWLGPRVAYLFRSFPGLNEAHNGYLEVYLNLGLLGSSLIALIVGQGYRRAVRAVDRHPTFGRLLVAYIVSALAYSATEAGFRMLAIPWLFLLLSALAASRMSGIDKVRSREQLLLEPSLWATAIPLTSADLHENT